MQFKLNIFAFLSAVDLSEDHEREAEGQKMEVMMELNSNTTELLLLNNDKEQLHKEATGNIDEWLWSYNVIDHYIIKPELVK